jgi:hypothetical protein
MRTPPRGRGGCTRSVARAPSPPRCLPPHPFPFPPSPLPPLSQTQHPLAAAARLVSPSAASPPIFLQSHSASVSRRRTGLGDSLGGAGGDEADDASEALSTSSSSSSSSSSSREAAAILSAVTASISTAAGPSSSGPGAGSESTDVGVSTLLARLAARDAAQLRHLMPSVVAALRTAAEGALTGGGAAGPSSHPTAHAQLRRVLRIIAGLAANEALPVEPSAGELLAAACSALLHAPRGMEVGKGAGAVAASDEARTRSYAARVVAALVDRAARVWPEVRGQAAGVLLDALAGAVDGEGQGEEDGDGMEGDDEMAGGKVAAKGGAARGSAKGSAGGGAAAAKAGGKAAKAGASSSSSAAAGRAAPAAPRLRITCWETLYGAAAGLASISSSPRASSEAAVLLCRAIRDALEDGALGPGEGSPPSSASVSATSAAAAASAQWRPVCADALLRALRRQAGLIGAPEDGAAGFLMTEEERAGGEGGEEWEEGDEDL